MGRTSAGRAEHGSPLTVLERLAPAPPRDLVVDRIEHLTAPGDVVLDLHGAGGWVARHAVDLHRRAVSLESTPLSRLLAELVLRPPDVRHLDAAFQTLGASPRGDATLQAAIDARFASRCSTCDRPVVVDEIVWAPGRDEVATPVRKHYRCVVCRDHRGGTTTRQAPVDDDDRGLAADAPDAEEVRSALRARFPVPSGGEALVTDLLDLHTPRQLLGLAWILARIEGDLRAEPIEAALRLAFLHAVLPASRLATVGARTPTLRVSGGRVRGPGSEPWRERNPWLAMEDGFRAVRTFVQQLDATPDGPAQARVSEDLRSLADTPTSVVIRSASTGTSLAALNRDANELASRGIGPAIRLAIGVPPRRPTRERTALAFHATAWALGRDAAAGLPVESLLGPPFHAPWAWHAAGLRRTLEAIGPLLATDARVVLLVTVAGPEAVVAAALAGAGAGYRLLTVRLGEPPGEPAVLELVPPGATLPPGPRTRANVALPPTPGGSGDPGVVAGPGLFAAPEPVDARPFSAGDAARTVTDTAVAVLKARGEPAPFERLLADILVGLDRAGQLRRLSALGVPEPTARAAGAGAGAPEPSGGRAPADAPTSSDEETAPGGARGGSRTASRSVADAAPADPVDRLVALIGDELRRTTQRRVVELEPGTWWVADRADASDAASPLADRVEWATYSILSTSGSMPEATFRARIAAMFPGQDAPDEPLVTACLESYRATAPSDVVSTGEDLVRRSAEHSELLAALADGGHRAGMQVWLSAREQARTLGGRPLGARLDEREQAIHLPLIARAQGDALEAVDCIWYVPRRAAFLFEVEWTAMLGDVILGRHARIPPDERLVRFLVVPPERAELVRHKIARSPLLRHALEDGNWHVLKWNHLRTWLAAPRPDLAALEPLLGLDPTIERTGEQLPLFAAEG